MRNSCVTESSNTERRRSLSRAASDFVNWSTVLARSMAIAVRLPIASKVSRDNSQPARPMLPTERTPMRSGMKQNPCSRSSTGSPRPQMAFSCSIENKGRLLLSR